jgi:hypothetical protein
MAQSRIIVGAATLTPNCGRSLSTKRAIALRRMKFEHRVFDFHGQQRAFPSGLRRSRLPRGAALGGDAVDRIGNVRLKGRTGIAGDPESSCLGIQTRKPGRRRLADSLGHLPGTPHGIGE